MEGVEGEAVNLTEPAVEAIASGFVKFLKSKKSKDLDRPLVVSVGHDSRISADSLLVLAQLSLLPHKYSFGFVKSFGFRLQ